MPAEHGSPGRGVGSDLNLPVASWAAWRSTDAKSLPHVAFADPQIRRRLSLLDRIALAVASACVKDGENVQLVFASRHGELARSAELLSQLAADAMPSPMAFSLSILNAAAGLYAIARGDRSPATAVSSGVDTFPMALVEAAAQANTAANPVVVLAYADEPPPAIYRELVDSPRSAFAMAVRFEKRVIKRELSMSWTASEAEDDPEASPVEFLRVLEQGGTAQWRGGGRVWKWTARGYA